ncbi:MAG: catalase [Agarilytica sp.]
MGDLQKPSESLAHNSSFKPVEALSSTTQVQVSPQQSFSNDESLAGSSQAQENSSGVEESGQSPAQQSQSRIDERSEREARLEQEREKQQLLQEQRQITSLSARDREVRAHEQAHAAVGGQYAGAPSYQFERGPDGVSYAISGEVPIDVGKEATPQETLRKAQIVRRAALAPAEPSPQDRRVAAQASQLEAQARSEISRETRAELNEAKEGRANEEENEAPNGLSEDITAESSSSTLASTPKPRFSAEDTNASAISTVSPLPVNTIASSQVLAFADIETNRPGALLNQLV